MLSATVEPFTACLEEIKPLLPLHWDELGIYRDKMPLAPQYGEYLRLDAAGAVLMVTLRSSGQLVGYFCGFITPGLHYGTTLQCKMDICFVLPEHRGGGGKMLFDAVKAELIRRGVQLWWTGSKSHHPIERFLTAFGFTQQESHFSMWLGAEDA